MTVIPALLSDWIKLLESKAFSKGDNILVLEFGHGCRTDPFSMKNVLLKYPMEPLCQDH